jgi:DNA-binding protein HU-beta
VTGSWLLSFLGPPKGTFDARAAEREHVAGSRISSGFLMFFLALRGLSPYSARRARPAARRPGGAPAAQFFDELFKLAVKELKGGAGKFVIPNIGRAVKAHRKARMGRNPQTGEAIKIKAKTVVRLRAAKAFKDAVLGS